MDLTALKEDFAFERGYESWESMCESTGEDYFHKKYTEDFVEFLSTRNKEKNTAIYGYPMKVDNKLDLFTKAVRIFVTCESIKTGTDTIRKRLITVLAYYTLYGYNKEAKAIIKDSLSINEDNLTQINSELSKSGFLINDTNNLRKKYLHPQLQVIQELYQNTKNINTTKAVVIKFNEF